MMRSFNTNSHAPMQQKLIWQVNSSHRDNEIVLQMIRNWWVGLNGQKVSLKRLTKKTISPGQPAVTPDEVSISPDCFIIENPKLEVTTLSFSKWGFGSVMYLEQLMRLELDLKLQKLDILCQSQNESLQYRVELLCLSDREA